MEKLRPILKQLFWISTGFVVLLAGGGWWMAMGSLNKSIEDGQKKLENRIKASKAGGEAPSEVWAAGAKQINGQYRSEFSAAELQLHRSQISTRTFPDSPAGRELQNITFLTHINDRATRARYRKLYLDHFLEQIKILDPFIVEDNRGLVVIDPDDIAQADMSLWEGREPTSSEIWTAQEDLWLLRSLFKSIAEVNVGSERLGTSPVRQILSLHLRGGSPSGGTTAGVPAAGIDGMGLGGLGLGIGGLNAGAVERADSSASGRTKSVSQNPGLAFVASFESDLLSEEFGPPPATGSSSGGSGGRSSKKKGKEEEDSWSWDDGPSKPKPPPVPVSTPANTSEIDGEMKNRYVDATAEYRTRAFLLHVRVTQEDIPSLLAELTNSSFPVEIVRVSAKFSEGTVSGSGSQSGVTSQGRADSWNDDDGGVFSLGRGRARGGLSRFGGGSSGRFPKLGGTARGRKSRRGGRDSGGLLSRLATTEYSAETAAKGEQQKQVALADIRLAELRIGGLLTLYRTKEENLNAEKTEKLDVLETQDADGDQPSAPESQGLNVPGADSDSQDDSQQEGSQQEDNGAADGDSNEDSVVGGEPAS